MPKKATTGKKAKKSVKKAVKKKATKKTASNKTAKKRVVFSLDAPNAANVSVVGTFNEWDPGKHQMKKDKAGKWTKIAILQTGTYEYKFLVDDDWWTDPECEQTATNEFGALNSVIEVS